MRFYGKIPTPWRCVFVSPCVRIVVAAPVSGSTALVPPQVALSATAADSGGSIAKVEFYRGADLIATVTAGQAGVYSAADGTAPAGYHSYTARAYDNGEVTSFTYDNAGQLTKVTLPDNAFISYTYDPAHRLTAMADNLGNSISYTLDLRGNRTAEQVKDPNNVLTQTRGRVFDALSRIQQYLGAQP